MPEGLHTKDSGQTMIVIALGLLHDEATKTVQRHMKTNKKHNFSELVLPTFWPLDAGFLHF